MANGEQYLRQMEKMSKNGVKAKNQLIDFIGLSKRHFCQKWLKIQIGEGIVSGETDGD
jgi:hypothetical protein